MTKYKLLIVQNLFEGRVLYTLQKRGYIWAQVRVCVYTRVYVSARANTCIYACTFYDEQSERACYLGEY